MHKPLLLSLLISLTATLLLDGWAVQPAPAATWLTNEHGEGWLAAAAGADSILSASYSWYSEGEESGEEYGMAVSGAGDVNGDGYADIAVGAPKSNWALDRAGAVFVFHGAPQGAHDTFSWARGGHKKGDEFGQAVASAGDVNGDGYDDLAIGAPLYNGSSYQSGAAFVYYGSADGLEPAAGWTVISSQQDSEYGYAVAGAGDVNGDGYDDLLVGARYYSTGENLSGTVFLYCGSAAGLNLSADWYYESAQAGASLGMAVGGAGDVNNDGYDDIAGRRAELRQAGEQ